MTVLSMQEHKDALQRLNDIKDVEAYEKVIMDSISAFHTYSVMEKAELYKSIALFNVGLVKIMLKEKYEDVE